MNVDLTFRDIKAMKLMCKLLLDIPEGPLTEKQKNKAGIPAHPAIWQVLSKLQRAERNRYKRKARVGGERVFRAS